MQNPGQEGDFSAQMIAALDREFNAQTGVDAPQPPGRGRGARRARPGRPRRRRRHGRDRRAHYEPMADGDARPAQGDGDPRPAPRTSTGSRSCRRPPSATWPTTRASASSRSWPPTTSARRSARTCARRRPTRSASRSSACWSTSGSASSSSTASARSSPSSTTPSSRSACSSLTGREIDIPTIAALLTLVGYSVNDTVVIFDRIRERIKLDRGKPLIEMMDMAINQTLSRTIITSGLT